MGKFTVGGIVTDEFRFSNQKLDIRGSPALTINLAYYLLVNAALYFGKIQCYPVITA